MKDKKRKRFTISVSAEIMDSTDRMGKAEGLDRSKTCEKLMWMGHASMMTDECVQLQGLLNLGIDEVQREGGSVDPDLIARSTQVIGASLLILGNCYSRSLTDTAQLVLDAAKIARAINENRWIKTEIDGAAATAKKEPAQ